MSGGALLVVGDVATDVVARHGRPLVAGTDTAARVAVLPGGAGANAACWAARCGAADVRLLARVGADSGGWHEAALRAAGVTPRLVVDAEAGTAVVVCLVDGAAERTFATDSGASLRLCAEDWDDGLLDGVGRLHLSGYLYFTAAARGIAARAAAAARARGVPVSVDPASAGFLAARGGPEAFLAAAGGCEVLLPNLDEARLLSGAAGDAEAAEALSRRTGGLVVVTLGAAGAVAARAGRLLGRVPAPAVAAVDSTGAGDAFTGGFLAALLAGADVLDAARAGCAAGSTAVGSPGGRPPAVAAG